MKQFRAILLTLLCVVCAGLWAKPTPLAKKSAPAATRVFSTTQTGRLLVMNMTDGLVASGTKNAAIVNDTTLRWFAFEEFVGGKCAALLHVALSRTEKRALDRRFKGEASLRSYPLGELRFLCVVHPMNTIESITLDGIGQLLRSRKEGEKAASWDMVDGIHQKVTCYLNAGGMITQELIQWKCMTWKDKGGGGRHSYRKDAVMCKTPAEILRKVASNSAGIGVFLYDPNDKDVKKYLERVKVLKVGATQKGPFVAPRLDPTPQRGYPLSELITLYLHPKASPLASKLASFCVSPVGVKIAEDYGLITPQRQSQYESACRLALAKEGKGPRISIVGPKELKGLFAETALDCAKEQMVVQPRYYSLTGSIALKRFDSALARGKSILFSPKKPIAISAITSGKPLLPETYSRLTFFDGAVDRQLVTRYGKQITADKIVPRVIGSRSMAVVVNSANKLRRGDSGAQRRIPCAQGSPVKQISRSLLSVAG